MSLEQRKLHSFGADDQFRCRLCGNKMSLYRRTPNGVSHERQNFSCQGCGHVVERLIDRHGKSYGGRPSREI
jgi:rubredoxin